MNMGMAGQWYMLTRSGTWRVCGRTATAGMVQAEADPAKRMGQARHLGKLKDGQETEEQRESLRKQWMEGLREGRLRYASGGQNSSNTLLTDLRGT